MAFPATLTILDQLVAPVGAMSTGNWVADTVGDGAMRIVSGGGAQSTGGVTTVSLWGVPVAVALSAFVTVTVLPTAPGSAAVGFADSGQLNSVMQVAIDPATGHVVLGTDAGSVPFTPGTLHNGDGIGITYNAGTDVATAWYRAAGAAAWTNLGTEAGAQTRAPTGWSLFLSSTDAVTLRLRDFGGETLPGPRTTLNAASVVAGHGAC